MNNLAQNDNSLYKINDFIDPHVRFKDTAKLIIALTHIYVQDCFLIVLLDHL